VRLGGGGVGGYGGGGQCGYGGGDYARKYVKFQKFVTVCPKGNNNVLTPFLNKFSSEYSFLNTISLICFATHNIGIRTRYCMRYHVVANQNSTLQQFSFPRGDLNTFS
jgi:hypothetical protein